MKWMPVQARETKARAFSIAFEADGEDAGRYRDAPVDAIEACAARLAGEGFAAVPEGAFFGDRQMARRRTSRPAMGFGEAETPYVMMIRHLPTEAVVAELGARYGEAGLAIGTEWSRLWTRIGGRVPDETAAALQYRGLEDKFGGAPTMQSSAGRMLAHAGRAEDAAMTVAAMHWRSPRKREAAAHALEDAMLQLAFERHGVDVAYVGFTGIVPDTRKMVRMKPRPGRCGREIRLKAGRGRAFWAAFQATQEYWSAPAFIAETARTTAVADGPVHACAVLLDMARQGHAKAFVKHTVQKAGTWVVDLDGVETYEDAMAAYVRGIGAEAFDLGRYDHRGRKLTDALLVQEMTPFHYEHRYFVVGGRIVASTASDRNLDAFDVDGGDRRIDRRVAVISTPAGEAGAYDRERTGSLEARRLVAAMTRKARRFIERVGKDAESKAIMGHAYVLDVGSLDPDPEVVTRLDLIEVNSFRRSGLYAADVDRIAAALKDAADWPEPPENIAYALTLEVREFLERLPTATAVRTIIAAALGGPDAQDG